MKTLLLSLTLVLIFSGCGRNPEKLNRKGIEALNGGKYAKASRLLEKAAEKSDGDAAAEIWGNAGLAAARAGQAGDAENLLKKALALDPGLPAANYNLGDLLIRQNRLDEAKEFLERAAMGGVDEALEALAGVAMRQGDLDAAVEFLQQARGREENARILSSLAVAGKNRLTVDASRMLLQQAVTLDPDYAPARLNLAALLDQNRLDPAQAASHYQAFLRLQPDDDKVPLVRQRLQIMEQREALGEFSRPDPLRREVEDLLGKAAAAAEAGDAVSALGHCLQANGVATRAQRTDLRERSLRAAATLVPDSARAHFGLGRFLLDQNRKTEAMLSLEQARSLAPGWPMSLRPAVQLAAELGRKSAAEKMLKQAEVSGAANPDLLLEVGDLYAEALNNPRESRRVYRAILDNFPEYSGRANVETRLNR